MTGLGQASTQPRLKVRNVSKTFTETRVLSGLDLDLMQGEVHAIAGHNGSGKSTFVKILAGFHRPDSLAEASVDGMPFELGSPLAADKAGLRFVHQDLGLINELSVVDNLFLDGQFPGGHAGRVSWRRARYEAQEVLDGLGLDIDPAQLVAELSPSQRTGVAIGRAIRDREVSPRILVLDEPTAALPAPDIERLMTIVANLQRQSLGILYISHHLEEIFRIATTVTVLRDGQRVITSSTRDLDEGQLVALMLGREIDTAARTPAVSEAGEVSIEVRDLRAALAGPLNFTVRSGEILGIAGVDGSGRESIASALFGGLPRQGAVRFAGRDLPAMRPDLSARRGMGYVPVDRAKDAMFGQMSLIDNVMAPRRMSRLKGLLLDTEDEVSMTRAWIERLDIRPARETAPIETLSGGNQQKAIVARWLRLNPTAMVFDEPTKGVDVGAVAAIWDLIQRAAGQGAAVVVCSSVSGELASYCSRVLVMRRGQVVGEFQGDELSDHTIDAVALLGESTARQEGLDS